MGPGTMETSRYLPPTPATEVCENQVYYDRPNYRKQHPSSMQSLWPPQEALLLNGKDIIIISKRGTSR